MVRADFRIVQRPDPRGGWVPNEPERVAFRELAAQIRAVSVPQHTFDAIFAESLELAATDLEAIAAAVTQLLTRVPGTYSIDQTPASHAYWYCETPEGLRCYHEYPLVKDGERIWIQPDAEVAGYFTFLCEYLLEDDHTH